MNGDNQKAITCYQQALKLLKSNTDSMVMAGIYVNLGNVMEELKDYDGAQKYFFLALDLYAAANTPPFLIAEAYNCLGGSYCNQKKYAEGRNYILKAVQKCDTINSKSVLMASYSNLGALYNSIHKNDSALYYYFRSLSFYRAINDVYNQSTLLSNIGCVYGDLKNFKQAEYYFLESYTDKKSSNMSIMPLYVHNLTPDLYNKTKKIIEKLTNTEQEEEVK